MLRTLHHLLAFPASSAETERSWSCVDGSCISCCETLVLTHPARFSLCNWGYNVISHQCVCAWRCSPCTSFLDACGTFSCRRFSYRLELLLCFPSCMLFPDAINTFLKSRLLRLLLRLLLLLLLCMPIYSLT